MQFRTTASTAYKSTIEGLGRIEFGLPSRGMRAQVDRIYDAQYIESGYVSVTIDV